LGRRNRPPPTMEKEDGKRRFVSGLTGAAVVRLGKEKTGKGQKNFCGRGHRSGKIQAPFSGVWNRNITRPRAEKLRTEGVLGVEREEHRIRREGIMCKGIHGGDDSDSTTENGITNSKHSVESQRLVETVEGSNKADRGVTKKKTKVPDLKGKYWKKVEH